MGWFDSQIKLRKKNDEENFERTFRKMASAVTGERRAYSAVDEKEKAENAIEDIAKYYHLPKKEIPSKISLIEEKLDYVFHTSGIMYRQVELTPLWRKDASGVFLAFRKLNGTPTALIPSGLFGYRYFDDEKGIYEKVDKNSEELFEKEAYAFYKSFPLKKLGIRNLAEYMLGVIEPRDYIMIILATMTVTLLGMLVPRINLFIFRDLVNSGSISLLVITMVFLLSVSWGSLLMSSVKNLISARIDTKMSVAVEAATMMRILSLPAGFFREYGSGELSSRASHVNSLCSTLVSVVLNTALSSVFSLVYLGQILIYAPGLVFPAFAIILATVSFSIATSLIQMKLNKRQMLIASKENGMSYALISGIQKIKLSGAEKRAFSRWGSLYAEEAEISYNPPAFIKINSVISLAISLTGTIVMYNQAIVTHVSAAEYFAFNTAYGMVSGAFMSLFSVALTAARIRPTFEMAEPILKAVPEISENKEILTKISGGIELVNLTFSYGENTPLIIDNLSLRINSGQYIAIVGKTGCGKSTLVRLLLGFEKPVKGTIFYDGKDINSIDLKSLRKHIGVVTQNGKLFQGDIYSNIVISAPYLTVDDAWEAARIAGIDEDIRRMPMGMNTIISEGSGGISGGQKQRLMIARAVAPKPKLLIFDEATSALDNITQRKVSEALDAMNCTRIVVAHRLSTIRQCDRILVFDAGHVVEDGKYEELIEKGGYFSELVKRQIL
ncbi:ATP-binding cassette domain-containing protein [Lachnospiraceae bacterium C1.1]|nr:ATP-binding cassette domain-containing protein [Lachnospiraceae bacterium C1.1]